MLFRSRGFFFYGKKLAGGLFEKRIIGFVPVPFELFADRAVDGCRRQRGLCDPGPQRSGTRSACLAKREEGLEHDAIMEIIWASSRDNSRTPMQWSAAEQAGLCIAIL